MTTTPVTAPFFTSSASSAEKTPPITADVLLLLLHKLQFKVNASELKAACERAKGLPAAQPSEMVLVALTQAQVKGVQPAQLMFRRMDLRRLPALVLHEDAWHLVERKLGQADAMTLTNGQGVEQQVARDVLQNAMVLWLRVAPVRQRLSKPPLL